MLFKSWLYFVENVEAIRNQFYRWAKGQNPNLTDQEVNQMIDQLAKEELQALNTQQITYQDYEQSNWARKRFRELLGTAKQRTTKEESPSQRMLRAAKGKDATYFQWIVAAVNPQNVPVTDDNIDYFKKVINDIDSSIFDYFKHAGIDPMKPFLSLEAAKTASDRWHQERYKKKAEASYKTPVTAGEPIGDMYMVELTPEDERAEGINMQHCVGDLCKVGDGNRIFSLRDKNNKPHVTIQVEDNIIKQIRGKQNKPPKLKYSDYVVRWILNHPEFKIETLDNMPLSRESIYELGNRLNKDEILGVAAERGYKDIVEDMLSQGASDYSYALTQAAYGGHEDIVELMMAKGAVGPAAIRGGLIDAAANGHINIVKLLLPRATRRHYEEAAMYASLKGHLDIVKLLIGSGARNYDVIMDAAADGDYVDIVKLMSEKGARDYESAAQVAAQEGSIKTFEFLAKQGIDFDESMYHAGFNGNMKIIKIAMENGATIGDYNEALIGAAEAGEEKVVRFMLKNGANAYKEAFIASRDSHNQNIPKLIKSYYKRSRQ